MTESTYPSHPKPHIIISKCIEFDNCRYNGQIIASDQIKELMKYVSFQPVCPEVEIGLGIPRNSIRIILKDGKHCLYQPETHTDITAKMISFTESFLQSLSDVDGFLLKSRSPSCGIKDVKVYPIGEKVSAIDKSPGFFGDKVLQHFSHVSIEDEGRLRNPSIREHFLRTIFTYARFREVKKKQSLSDLITFHANHKFMFMAYKQQGLKQLGRIVANQENLDSKLLINQYETMLHKIFSKAPRCTSNINVLMHAYGYFKKDVSKKEQLFFLSLLDDYRDGKQSLASVVSVLKSWIIRFDQEYLQQQYFFSPYPDALLHPQDIDACSSKNYWK